jgi:hypothetical protein
LLSEADSAAQYHLRHPGTTIVGDAEDAEQLARPRTSNIRATRTFMILFGLVDLLFDLATFAMLPVGFDAASTPSAADDSLNPPPRSSP